MLVCVWKARPFPFPQAGVRPEFSDRLESANACYANTPDRARRFLLVNSVSPVGLFSLGLRDNRRSRKCRSRDDRLEFPSFQ